MAQATNDSYDIVLLRTTAARRGRFGQRSQLLLRTTAAHRGRFGQRSQEWPSVAQP